MKKIQVVLLESVGNIKFGMTKQEVREIVISNEIAGIIYRNKIEIVKF